MESIQIIDRATARTAIFMAKTLENKTRYAIMQHIMAAGEAGCTVTNIYTDPKFRYRPEKDGGEMEQSECSQHLQWLRNHGFVTTERQGKNIIYMADFERIEAASTAIRALAALKPVQAN